MSVISHHDRTAFDQWQSITLALYMTLVGYGVLVGIPVISTAWVELLGFSEEQVGRVAGADLGGLSAGAVLTALLIRRMNRRHLVLIGGGLAIAANALCTVYLDYETVLWLRFAAGVGSGIYTAVAVATLGASSKPARAYNLMLFASLMPGAQGLGQIVGPNIAASMLGAGMGYQAVFAMCAAAAVLGMLVYLAMYLYLRLRIPALARAT